MQAYAEGFDLFDKCEYDLTTRGSPICGARARWCAPGCASSPLAPSKPTATTCTRSPATPRTPARGVGQSRRPPRATCRRPRSPPPLYARFSSRGNGDYANRVLARAAQPVRGARGQEAMSSRRAGPENPLVEGLERLPVSAHDARDLRRHRGPRAAQAAARALQPRARGGAARALPPGGRLAQREGARRLPRGVRAGDPQLLPPPPRRGRARGPARAREVRARAPSTTSPSTGSSRRCSTASSEQAGEPLNRAFYLSTAPDFFPVIVEALGKQGLDRHEDAEVRVIIEKPFGTSLAEAAELNRRVLDVFDETQVFRIDHYLGKETVQNMLAFRFANGHVRAAVEPQLHRLRARSPPRRTSASARRAGYYDNAGALRDLIQNHMLQLLCHVAMEPPVSFTAEEVRNEKVKVLHAIHAPGAEPTSPEMAVRAPVRRGALGGEDVPGYLEEEGVPRAARTPRPSRRCAWRSTTGAGRGCPSTCAPASASRARSPRSRSRSSPSPTSPSARTARSGIRPNQLILTLQPNEGVSLQLGAKIPGTRMIIRPVNMEFLYGTAFLSQSPEAYERLIMDAMRGDPTLFTRNDEVEAQWEICDPIVQRVGSRAGAAAPVRGRLAGARRGRAACCPRATPGARSDPAGPTPCGASRAPRPTRSRPRCGEMLAERHAENGGFVPARALNMIAFVDRAVERGDRQPPARGGALPRLASGRARLRARPRAPRRARDRRLRGRPGRPGELSLLRETVIVELGDRHLDDLYTIADPLVVTDLPTLLWSPHGHHEVIDGAARARAGGAARLRGRARLARGARPRRRPLERAYVVDLAWLRSTPWRERIATAFDPPQLRRELPMIARSPSATTPTPRSPRCCSPAGSPRAWAGASPRSSRRARTLSGKARARRQDVELRLQAAPELQVRGLAGLDAETASGRRLRLDRGPGGLHAVQPRPAGRRAASGRSSAPPAARRASSARASARRSCATPPTRPRCAPHR